MDYIKFRNRLQGLFIEYCNLDSTSVIGSNENLFQIGMEDDLDIIEFILFVEEKTGIMVEPQTLGNCNTFGDLCEVIYPFVEKENA